MMKSGNNANTHTFYLCGPPYDTQLQWAIMRRYTGQLCMCIHTHIHIHSRELHEWSVVTTRLCATLSHLIVSWTFTGDITKGHNDNNETGRLKGGSCFSGEGVAACLRHWSSSEESLHSSRQTGSGAHWGLGGSGLALLGDREIGFKTQEECVRKTKLQKE